MWFQKARARGDGRLFARASLVALAAARARALALSGRRPAFASPLVSTVGFLTCLAITAFTDGRHGRNAGALCGAAEAGSAADGF